MPGTMLELLFMVSWLAEVTGPAAAAAWAGVNASGLESKKIWLKPLATLRFFGHMHLGSVSAGSVLDSEATSSLAASTTVSTEASTSLGSVSSALVL